MCLENSGGVGRSEGEGSEHGGEGGRQLPGVRVMKSLSEEDCKFWEDGYLRRKKNNGPISISKALKKLLLQPPTSQ